MTDHDTYGPDGKIRVLYIDHTIYKSGAAISLGTLIRHLPSRISPHFILRTGSDVRDIIGAADKPVCYERFMPQFMTTLRTPQYSPFLFIWHLSKIIPAFLRVSVLARDWKIDLLHLNETALLPYVFIGRVLGIPVVMHARGATAPRPIEQYFLNMIGSFSNTAIIAIDEETRQSLPAKCQQITKIIYNPVDIAFKPDAEEIEEMRKSWGCSDEDVVVGQVASLHTSKGIWDIIEIALDLCKKYDRLKFVLVGDDRAEVGEGAVLRGAIRQKGLQERVILPGYLSNVPLVYAALDIALCLFGKYLGGVGRQAYEAAMAGKPLIATMPNPVNSQTVKHGLTGIAVRSNDKQGILNALCQLIENKAERISLGKNAIKEIGDRHHSVRISEQVASIYRDLLRKSTS